MAPKTSVIAAFGVTVNPGVAAALTLNLQDDHRGGHDTLLDALPLEVLHFRLRKGNEVALCFPFSSEVLRSPAGIAGSVPRIRFVLCRSMPSFPVPFSNDQGQLQNSTGDPRSDRGRRDNRGDG
jgi:hypothetical protein